MIGAFLPLFCLLPLIAASQTGAGQHLARKRSLPRRQDNTTLIERDLVARGPPAGWFPYLAIGNDGGGCYGDRVPRILPDLQLFSGSSSVEGGLKACQDRGFKWAGLQNGHEIFNAPSSDCSIKCSSGENCGGGWRMNVYAFSDPNDTKWVSRGCYLDGIPRVLPGYSMVDGSMTAGKCQSACAARGYKVAGVENGIWALSVYELSTPEPPAQPVPWNYVSCLTDGNPRALGAAKTTASDMTTAKCTAFCASGGFTLAGTQWYSECYCANTVTTSNGQGQRVGDGECNVPCSGDAGQKCGGGYRMSLYSTLTGSALAAALGAPVTTTTTAALAATTAATATTAAPAAPTPVPASPQSFNIPTNIPGGGSSGNKQIYAHLIVGNTYPYNINTWRTDIGRAQSAGIDGFMLNIGPDYGPTEWQPLRVADAYAAAQEKGFKMVLSFDMYEFDCGGYNRWVDPITLLISVPLFQRYLQNYINHPAAGKYQGKSILTTFAGESCSFGQGSTNAGWNAVMGQWKNQIYFAPSYNGDPQTLSRYELGAEVSWGSAWPVAGSEIETSRDYWFMQQLGGRGYIGTVSPLFAAHIPGKNYIWRGDNFLYGARWDQLLSMRDRTDIVQVVSWNDYGESTYINEITGDMPQAVKDAGYVTSDSFYSAAWKNGAYPAIVKDQIWAMARPHQAWAGAGGEAPQRREVTNDNLYVQVHLLAPASVILCSGGCSTKQGVAGINRFSQPLQVGQTASARVERNGQVVARVDGSVVFASSSPRYNFNYWILTSG